MNIDNEKLLEQTKTVLSKQCIIDIDNDLLLKIIEEAIAVEFVEKINIQLNNREKYALRDYIKSLSKGKRGKK